MAHPLRVTVADIYRAHERILPYIHKTPVFTNATYDKKIGRNAFFKAENLQKTGAFKVRGALNATLSLKEKNPDVKGVMDAIRGYGSDLVLCEPTPDARQAACDKVAKERGYHFVPPYDHHDVIAGQGTIAVEFLEQVPDLDAILVPVSGGGMTSGIAIAAKAIKPEIKVFMVEPEGKNAEESLRAGERLWPNPPRFINTIADAIRLQQLGHVTWPILLELAEKDVFSVKDEEIIEGMKFAFQRMKGNFETYGM
ncbi:hypothetical protein KUTeg_009791 [Tegillarca granosa]|uniref:Tryptophan synthase beta chain-like PALP domain-containing protein n=1 Tax=Tegillarca granosa TaxID=220873 RepID=A0ABQ9F9Y1_TEGGR|nr:hypothetical protein KUTeg_009791 [Tegillarca granosa]